MRLGRAVLVLLACAPAFGGAAAHAAEGSGPTAVVAMGDSYISGEAGRWAGNSVSATPGNDGTDRACQPAGALCLIDRSRVYGATADGCHRSDVAEVVSASLPVPERINLSCSGAVTTNLLTTGEGGTGQDGEAPQGDQLGPVARDKDVQAVVVSIGGNDLGFAGIVARCLAAYTGKTGPCEPAEQPKLAAAIPDAQRKVQNTLASIRAVMRGAGYADDGYRLIVQTYPSVAGRASELRFGEADPRRTSDGCPNYDTDATWARDEASKEIGDMVTAAATASGAEVLDVGDLFQGHEVCATSAAQSTPTAQPDAAHAEWGRFVGAGTVQQGQLQEAFHPNAYGQQALATCLTAVFAAQPGTFRCSGAAGVAPGAVTSVRTGGLGTAGPATTTTKPRPARKRRLAVKLRRLKPRGRRVCFAVRVRAGKAPVRRATVRFGTARKRTGKRGRTTICARVKPGTRRVRVTKAGYRGKTRKVSIRRAGSRRGGEFRLPS